MLQLGPVHPVGHTQRFGAIHVRLPSQLIHMAVGSRQRAVEKLVSEKHKVQSIQVAFTSINCNFIMHD